MDISDEEFEAGRARWLLNELLKFWTACPVRRCRRARSCVGDFNRCHAIFWPAAPRESKVRGQAMLDASREGRSATQASRAADAAAADWRKREAAIAKLTK